LLFFRCTASLSADDVARLRWLRVVVPADRGGDPWRRCLGVVLERVCGILRLSKPVDGGVERWVVGGNGGKSVNDVTYFGKIGRVIMSVSLAVCKVRSRRVMYGTIV
jgi:hypothetical protein